MKGRLSKATHLAFKSVTADSLEAHPLSVSQEHARIEARSDYTCLKANVLDGNFSRWEQIKTIDLLFSYRLEKGKLPQLQQRYCSSSAARDEQDRDCAVRGPWIIENSLHGVLDVTMLEDACKVYKYPENSIE